MRFIRHGRVSNGERERASSLLYRRCSNGAGERRMMVAAAEAEAEAASAKYSRPRSFLRDAATSANETTRERAGRQLFSA